MSKSKEKSKEAPKTSKRGNEGDSNPKLPAARESSSKIAVARESSSKIPVARESTGKMPAASSGKMPAARESTGKMPAARESTGKMPAARESSSKIPAAKASDEAKGERTSGKMKAAKPSESKLKAKAPPEEEIEEGEEGDDEDRPKRAMGLRGAAPWAARHAAKHAAEARKRAAEPPPPGSARATIRTPSGVEEIKARIGELHNASERVKGLRKNLAKTFFEVGLVLRDIQEQRLYAAKGFQSFEAFAEREIDLSKSIALRLIKLVSTFTREKALEMGYERALDALAQLEGSEGQQTISDSKLPIAKPAMPTSVTRGPIVGR